MTLRALLAPGPPLHLLHLAHIRWYNAEAQYAVDLATAQRARGHRVALLGQTGSPTPQRARQAGLEAFEEGGFNAKGLGFFRAVPAALRLAVLLSRRRFDAVTVHRPEGLPLIAWAGRRAGVPVVRVRGDMRPVRADPFNRLVYRRGLAAVVASNTAVEASLRARLGELPHLSTIHGGVDPDAFRPQGPVAALREELGVPPGALLAGILGRVGPVKGHEHLLAAVSQAVDSGAEVHLVLLVKEGPWALEPLREQVAADSRLRGRVHFSGHRVDLPAVLRAFDLGVVASVGSEANCRVGLEWMACGVPLLATRIGVLPDLVEEGQTGFLVPPVDASSLARNLVYFAHRPDEVRRLGAAARRRAKHESSMRDRCARGDSRGEKLGEHPSAVLEAFLGILSFISITKPSVPVSSAVAGWQRDAQLSVARNRKIFDRLVVSVEADRIDRSERALVGAEMAADFAWRNHPGLFASPELERVVLQVGEALPEVAECPEDTLCGSRPRVLHVLTQTADTGGHTRLAWNWMEADASCTHCLALTGQGGEGVAGRLVQAVERSGGVIRDLSARGESLSVRAARLRRLAAQSDRVVLHVHPYDVVPLAALAAGKGLPPVILLNHADHVFWVGASGGYLVVNLRESGRRLAVERRGFAAERTALLPLPLDPAERTLERAEAKRRLGLDPECSVLLSVASKYKYGPLGEADFLAVHERLLAARDDAVLLVIGPASKGRWQAAATRTGGRLRALGRQADLSLYYQSADLYVDSFPFGSLTSLLEAASFGTAAVSHAPFLAEAAVVCADDPALPGDVFQPEVERYVARVNALLDDRGRRLREGRSLGDAIRTVHAGAGWKEQLFRVCEAAERTPATELPTAGALGEPGFTDWVVCGLHRRSGVAKGLYKSVRDHAELPGAPGLGWLAAHGLAGALLADVLGQRLGKWIRSASA